MKNKSNLNAKCHQWIKTLCVDISERIPGKGYNVTGRKGQQGNGRIGCICSQLKLTGSPLSNIKNLFQQGIP